MKEKKILFLANRYGVNSNLLLDILEENINNILIKRGLYQNLEIRLDTSNKQNPVIVTIDGKDISHYNMVVFRNWIKPGKKELVHSLGKYLSYKKIMFIDDFIKDVSFGPKLFQTLVLAIHGIDVPKTIFIPTINIINKYEDIKDYLGLPFVLKKTTSDKGKDNYLINNFSQFKKYLDNSDDSDQYLCQEFIENDGDNRVLVTNFKATSAELRVRKDKSDHRNNASLGGIEKFITLTELGSEKVNLAEKTASIFKINICGVDILTNKSNSTHYIIEANASPEITFKSTEEESTISYYRDILDKFNWICDFNQKLRYLMMTILIYNNIIPIH